MTSNYMSNNAGNGAVVQGVTQVATLAARATRLTPKLAAMMAVVLMSGVAMTAHADNHDRKPDRSAWSGGKHVERGARHRGDRPDSRSYRPEARGKSVHHERRYVDQRVRDRHWDRGPDRTYYRARNYSDYQRYPYYRSQQRYRIGTYYRPTGYYYNAWHRGDRLPRAYYAPRYVVYDYGRYGLYRPPYGYHWVRVDGDVILAAITTGLVMQVVNQIFW